MISTHPTPITYPSSRSRMVLSRALFPEPTGLRTLSTLPLTKALPSSKSCASPWNRLTPSYRSACLFLVTRLLSARTSTSPSDATSASIMVTSASNALMPKFAPTAPVQTMASCSAPLTGPPAVSHAARSQHTTVSHGNAPPSLLWNSLLSYLISSYQLCLSHLIKQTIYPFPSHHCLAL